jgi:CheY-like chemotaxis protein
MKVLIVDDNERARGMIRKYLRGLSDDFCECADGFDALDCYEKALPDWVLMDWEMKRMNGLEATRRIVEKYPQAKILMVTNHDKKDLRRAAQEAGAKGFVTKDDLQALRPFFDERNVESAETRGSIK